METQEGFLFFGGSFVRPEFRTGRMNASRMRDQDLNFQALSGSSGAQLIVPCWYEHARESLNILTAFKLWVSFEKPRAKLFQKAREKGIENKDLRRAFLYYWQAVRWQQHMLEKEPGYEPDWPQYLRTNARKDNLAAEKLLSELSDKYHQLIFLERMVEEIETCEGAPRLRVLAKHLVKDTPWLLISVEDQKSAIANAFKNHFFFFRTVPPFETEDELQKLVLAREALPGFGEEDVPSRLRLGHTNSEIIKNVARWLKDRPKKWKHKGKATGRRRPETWCWVALQDLAAMRLMHVLPREAARAKFSKLYARSIEGADLRRLRRNSIERFQRLFDTDEKPRHAETRWQRDRKRGSEN